MFRSNWFFKRFHTLVAPAIALALVVAAFFFTGQLSVTVAKAAANTQQTLNLVPSFVLDIIGTGSGAQSLAPARPSTSFQSIDLVPSFVRDIIGTGSGAQIFAPAIVVHAQPVNNFQKIDLGAGYVLEMTANGGRVLAPRLVSPSVQTLSLQTIYLTDGYVLKMNGTNGQVISPSANTFKVQPVVYPQSFYIGLGYQFVFNADGGHVVALGAP